MRVALMLGGLVVVPGLMAQTPGGNTRPMQPPVKPGELGGKTTGPGGSTAVSPSDKPVDKPADKPSDKPADKSSSERTITVNFKNAHWDDVLEWFAKESGLTPILTVRPTGSVTLLPPKDRKFTLGEVVDLLNEALIQQRFILIRRQISFYIHPSDEKIDASWVPRIELSELPSRGRTELVQVIVPLKTLSVEETGPEVQRMLSPFGMVSSLSKLNALVILDTAGNIQRILEALQKVENELSQGDILTHVCRYKRAQEVAEHLKTLLSDNAQVTVAGTQPTPMTFFDPRFGGGGGFDGRGDRRGGGFDRAGPAVAAGRVKSVQIAVDAKANSVTITAPPEKIQLAKKIIEDFDKPRDPFQPPLIIRDPELRKYPVPAGTAQAIAQALQADHPTLRIIALPQTNEVIVSATPEEHLAIVEKMRSLTQGGETTVTTEFIPLSVLDPTSTAATVAKLYPSTGTAGGPTVEAHTTGVTPGLLVKGTTAQINDVKKILADLGERPGGQLDPRIRTFTLPDGSASILAEHLARTLQQLGKPAIVVDPNAPTPPQPRTPPPAPAPTPGGGNNPPGQRQSGSRGVNPLEGVPGVSHADPTLDPKPMADSPSGPPLHYVSAQTEPKKGDTAKGEPPKGGLTGKPVIIQVVGNRIIIQSEDTEALDILTGLMRTYTVGTPPTENLFKVIKLKNVSAEEAAAEITEIFNGPQRRQQGGPGGGRGGLGGLLGGGGPLGLLGGLFGGGGGGDSAPAGTNPNRIRVVAIKSTNALVVVKASPADLLAIESLLANYIDRGPDEDALALKTWILPVKNADAAEMAAIIRDVYRSALSSGGNQPAAPIVFPFAPLPQANQQNQRPPALTVSVDDRTNSLILNCSEPLFKDIKALVEQLDRAATSTTDVARLVKLGNLDPNVVQAAVLAVQGINPQQNRMGGFGMGGFGNRGPGGFGMGGFGAGGFGGGGPFGGGGFGGGGGPFGGGGFGGRGPAMGGGFGGGLGGPAMGGGFGGGLGGPAMGGGFGGGGRGGLGGGGLGGGGGRGGGGRGGRQAIADPPEGPRNFDSRGTEAPSAHSNRYHTATSTHHPAGSPADRNSAADSSMAPAPDTVVYDPVLDGPPSTRRRSLLSTNEQTVLTPTIQPAGGTTPSSQPANASGVVTAAGMQPPPMQPPLPPGQPVPPAPLPGELAPRGPVTVVPLPELNAIILRATNATDLQLVLDLIETLREISRDAQPRLEVIPLEYQDCNAVANWLTTLFSRVLIAGPGGTYLAQQPVTGVGGVAGLPGLAGVQAQQNRGIYFLALPRFNSILVAAPQARFNDILREIRRIDRPNAEAVFPRAFRLKKASAQIVALQLQQFWNARFPGDPITQNQFRVTFDIPTNTVYVQGPRADLEDIERLIHDLDTSESQAIQEVRVIRIRNGIASEIAQVISNALNVNVVNPLVQAQLQQPVAPAAGGTAGLVTGVGGVGGLGGLAGLGGLGAAGGALGAGGLGGAAGLGGLGGLGAAGLGGLGAQQPGAGLAALQPGGAAAQQQEGALVQTVVPTVGTAIGGGLVTKSHTLRLYSSVDGKLVAESGLLSDVHLIPSTRINAIIVMAPAKTMTLIEKLIEELDTVSAARSIVKVFHLRKAQASLMANLIRQLFTGQQQVGVGGVGGLGGLGAAGALQAGQPRPLLTPTGEVAEGALLVDLRLSVDDRTNSLIVAGSRTDMDLIEALIARLEDTEVEERFYEVFKLKNTSAADVQNAVNQFIVDSLNVLTATTPTLGGSFLDAYQRLQRDVVLVAEPVSNTLLVSATPRLFKDIKRIIERLDAQPPQVMIQVMIADVQLNNAMEFGLEVGLQSPVLFQRGPTNPGFNFNTTAPLGTGVAGPGIVGFQGLSNLGVGRIGSQSFGGFIFTASSQSLNVVLRALQAQGRVEILSRPQVQVMDNQVGFIQVGQDFPVPTNVNVTGLTTQQGIQYRQVGVVMRVTPRISPDGKIVMRIEPQVSSVSPNLVSLGGGLLAPAFNIQTVQTTVVAADGETVVLGGLITRQDSRLENGLPFLKDIPYVGALFRYRQHQVQRREVLIIMTPHIVRSEADHARLLAEEAARMNWCVQDIARLHGHGMEIIGPAMEGAKVVPVPPTGSSPVTTPATPTAPASPPPAAPLPSPTPLPPAGTPPPGPTSAAPTATVPTIPPLPTGTPGNAPAATPPTPLPATQLPAPTPLPATQLPAPTPLPTGAAPSGTPVQLPAPTPLPAGAVPMGSSGDTTGTVLPPTASSFAGSPMPGGVVNALPATGTPAAPGATASTNTPVSPAGTIVSLPGKPYQLVYPATTQDASLPAANPAASGTAAEPARRRLFGTKEGRAWNPFGH
ncbi:MAG: hypothetical protein NZ703_00555 [Gemmataceae bacterium]|nr:hypothetical protein [Gemmataceae bacterium]